MSVPLSPRRTVVLIVRLCCCCLLALSSAALAEMDYGPQGSREAQVRKDVTRVVLAIHKEDVRSYYSHWKESGDTDAEIAAAFCWWIEQPAVADGEKDGAAASRAGMEGLYLLPGDATLQAAVIEAQRHPERYYRDSMDMKAAVVFSRNEALLAAYRAAGFGSATLDEWWAKRDQMVAEFEKPGFPEGRDAGAARKSGLSSSQLRVAAAVLVLLSVALISLRAWRRGRAWGG